MSDSAKIERITRSLAFMLRHQPDKFDLEVDAHGFAAVDDVIRALGERLGETVNPADLELAMDSGDRKRYEIQGDRIRALYGHSIPVEPGTPSQPPDVLFVAIPKSDADRASRFGLRGGRRRFLHLALNVDDARGTGRRAAREYTVLSIRALEAWEEGVNFYDRHSLWLAEDIPTHLIEVEGNYDDGREPMRGPRRQGRRDDRRGGRSDGRRGGRRERGGGRRDDRGSRDSRSSRGRGSSRDRGDRGDSRDHRDRGRDRSRGDGERSAEIPRPARHESRREEEPVRAPVAQSEKRESATKPGRPSREPTAAATPFGSGIEEPAPVVEEKVVAPEPVEPDPVPEPVEPEPVPEPEKPEDDGLPSFGAGL